MPSIPLWYWELSQELPSYGDQVTICYPHQRIMAHILKVGGQRVNFIELPLQAAPGVTTCLHFGCWVQVTSHEEVAWQIQGSGVIKWNEGARAPAKVWGPWGVIPAVEIQGSSDELVAASLIMATSESGTPAVQRRAAFSATASRLAWMATRNWTFCSCASMSFSFLRRRSFMFWKWRIQEKGHISYRIRLLGVSKTHAVCRKGQGY